ncbi:hypothetical protein A6R74_03295 [Halomonas sp. ALS9]|nr:hypothetical protein A6R74_03295 [Halomonas sp. ALS9]
MVGTNAATRNRKACFCCLSAASAGSSVCSAWRAALYLISDNDHYQLEIIKPQDMHDVEIMRRCEIRIGRVV